jgi:predicted nucleotidyltransferase
MFDPSAYVPELPIDQERLVTFCRENGINYLAVFGSYARGDFTPESDIDLLVRFSGPIGLFRYIGIERELGEALGRKVDLATEDGLSPYIHDRVMAELKEIYAEPGSDGLSSPHA